VKDAKIMPAKLEKRVGRPLGSISEEIRALFWEVRP
jgi:hypothetical protein